MFALGQFQGAKLVPSHRAGIVLAVGCHVEPLLDPLDVAGLAPVGPVIFLQGLRIKPDPIAAIQLVADAGTRIGTQPEMIRAGRGDSQIVFSPAILLTWLGEVGDLSTAGEFCGVHGIEPGVAVRLAPRGILALDPQERRLRSPRQSNHAGHAGPNDSQQVLSQDLSPTNSGPLCRTIVWCGHTRVDKIACPWVCHATTKMPLSRYPWRRILSNSSASGSGRHTDARCET